MRLRQWLRLNSSICCFLLAAVSAAEQLPIDYKELPRGTGVYRGRSVQYRVLNGQALVEGDILLGPVEALDPAKADARDAIVIAPERYRWPNAIVVYEVDAAIPNKERITQAIAEWEANTPIRFRVRAAETDYVRIQRASSGCSSNLGRIGGRQTLNLSDSCSLGNAIHELGHTLGLFHTQSRIDRDRNIRVLFENLDKAYWDQYEKELLLGEDVGPYDYGSIMHYGGRGFERNTRNGMETTPRGIPIGVRASLSTGDILAVRKIYGESPAEVTITSHPVGQKIIVDGEEITTPKAFPWKAGERHTVSAVDRFAGANANQEFRFAKWSDGGAMEHVLTVGDNDYLFIASYAQFMRVRTSVVPESAGTVETTPFSADGFYPFGSVISLRAVPSGDLKFLDWRAGAGGTVYLTANAQGSGSMASEYSVRNDDAFYVANFTRSAVTTVTSQPPGVLVSVDGLAAYTPRNFEWADGTTHSVSIVETQPINNATARAAFVEWSNGEPRSHEYRASGDGRTLTALVKRRFEVLSAVDSAVLSGSMFARPSQLRLTPEPVEGFYDEGSQIEVMADGTASVPFANFYSDLSMGVNPQKLVVKDQSLVGANFLSPPLFNARSLVNLATQLPSPASPGAMMMLYSPELSPDESVELTPGADGHYPVASNSVRLLWGDTAAELVRISKNSMTFLVPWDVGSRQTVGINLFRPGTRSPNTLPAAPSAPGLFTVDPRGTGQAAALNQDGSANSSENPAFRGHDLTFSVTGIGRFSEQMDNSNPPAGALTPVQRLEVELGEAPVEVLGISSTEQPGKYHVRVRISDATPVGDGVSAFIISGGTRSQFGVTVSIR